MSGIVASKTGFYLVYILLFTATFFYGIKFTHSEAQLNSQINEIEDSVVVNRVIKCFSDEEFGVVDNAKVSEENLRKCLGGKYNLAVKLIKQIGETEAFSIGKLGEHRHIVRSVIVENSVARLEVDYSKNAA